MLKELLIKTTKQMEGNPESKWTSLMHLLTEDYLKSCFGELKKNASPGVDRVSVSEYGENLEENISDLVNRMKKWQYRPQPVKRVNIKKPDGRNRPLGLPSTEDKVVQQGIKQILEEVFEEEFLDASYGFRPGKSCHGALEALDKSIMTCPVNYVVDVDVENFFDSISHKWMIEALKQKISDRNFLRLISRFLKSGVMESGKYISQDKGSPQGMILSPILANIYLHYILDQWFEKKVKPCFKGYSAMFRYADDVVFCFQKGEEARKFFEVLKKRLARYGLKISESKSKIIQFGRYADENMRKRGKKPDSFDFLGFTHYCDKTRSKKFKVGRKTSRKKFIQKAKAMNEWLRRVRNLVKLKDWWKVFRIKLIGHYRYYGISGNYQAIKKFYRLAVNLGFKWINRRSQKKSYNLKSYFKFLEYNPLPLPKIYHVTYNLQV